MARRVSIGRRPRGSRFPSPEKAGKILEHGEVRGQRLSRKQRGLFGLLRGGKKPTRLRARGR